MAQPLVGLDLGGTKLLGVAVDANSHQILASDRVDTPATGAEILDAIETMTNTLAAEVGAGPEAVGIGAAGLVDQFGVLRFGPNLPGVINLDFAAALEPRLSVPVLVDNDATCGALAEQLVGSARDAHTALIVALGTGIGGGLIMDGRIRRGAHRMGGEFGHVLVNPEGPMCGCGHRGCWEQMASGNALGRMAREAAANGTAPSVLAEGGGVVEDLTGVHVTAAAAAGHSDALRLLDEFSRWVAAGLAGLVDVCDPELIVIGGGLAEAGDLLLDPVRRYLAPRVMGAGHRPEAKVVAATAGEAAGAVGAALLAGAEDPWG